MYFCIVKFIMYSLFKKPILITFLFDEIKKYFLFTCKIVGCNYIFSFQFLRKKIGLHGVVGAKNLGFWKIVKNSWIYLLEIFS